MFLLRVIVLLAVVTNAVDNKAVDDLRNRMYHMENIFRDDIDVIREKVTAEIKERETFVESFTDFMKFVNDTLVIQSPGQAGGETLHDSVLLDNIQAKMTSLGVAFTTLKKISIGLNHTVEHLISNMQSYSVSVSDIKSTLSRVNETCTAVYTQLCSCKGGVKKGEQCYLKLSHRLKWSQAQTFCQSVFDGHLAVIYDKETNDLIAAKATEYEYFVDGTDRNREGHWIWESTGEEMQYTNWIHGQPDNSYGEHCLAVRGDHKDYGRKWNDMPCGHELPFVCQRSCKSL